MYLTRRYTDLPKTAYSLQYPSLHLLHLNIVVSSFPKAFSLMSTLLEAYKTKLVMQPALQKTYLD